jgi:hypothetical protein
MEYWSEKWLQELEKEVEGIKRLAVLDKAMGRADIKYAWKRENFPKEEIAQCDHKYGNGHRCSYIVVGEGYCGAHLRLRHKTFYKRGHNSRTKSLKV